jgi:hypothetical protein
MVPSGCVLALDFSRRRISCRAVFAPAVFDFDLQEIKCERQLLNNTPVVLCASLEYRRRKKTGPEVLCRTVEYRRSKNQTGCSPGNSPLCRNPNTAGATLSGTPLLQRAVELHRRSLILPRCPLEPPLAEMALRRGALAVYFHHAGANSSAGNASHRGNPGLKSTRTDAILKKFD